MIKIKQLVAASLLAAGLSGRAHAQSLVGRWDGATTSQQGKQGVTFTFDSLAAGWKGSWVSESYGSGPLGGVELKADTVWFSLNIQGTGVDFQGTLSADRKTLKGYIWIGGQDGGTFGVTRFEQAKTPPAKPPLH